jgi:hypothetical protein
LRRHILLVAGRDDITYDILEFVPNRAPVTSDVLETIS